MKKVLLLLCCILCALAAYSQNNISKLLRIGEKDEYNNTVIYTHKNVSYHSWVPIAAQIEVSNKTGICTLLLKLYYSGSNWIFFERVLFKYTSSTGEDKEFVIDVDLKRKNKIVNLNGSVVESIKIIPTTELKEYLTEFANNCNGYIRFEGEKYHNVKADKLYLKPFLETVMIYESMQK